MTRYPDVTGPPRSYVVPALVALGIGAALFVAYWWYLQGLEAQCKQQCVAKGARDYRYVEPTGTGKHFRRGDCSCVP